MGRDFKYIICQGCTDTDLHTHWEHDLYLRNNYYLPWDSTFSKKDLLKFIENIEIDKSNIKDYGEAIRVLTNIYDQMNWNDFVHLRND